MPVIYLDNAATSWPKAPGVAEAMARALETTGSPGRGGHSMSRAAGEVLAGARQALARLLMVSQPERLIFTLNATHALNQAIRGVLKPGDHALTTEMEHNSVLRPLHALQEIGVEVTILRARDGLELPELGKAMRPNTRLVAMTHASNVTGQLLPAREAAALAHAGGALFLLDVAQTAGHLPLDLGALGADLVAMPGHKGLLGPSGTGVLYVAPGVAMEPLLEGGTGSFSDLERQPECLPERYEAGTPNTVGVAGLEAALRYLAGEGVARIAEREKALLGLFLEGLGRLEGVRVYGPAQGGERVALVSLNLAGHDPQEVAFLLDNSFRIAVRGGLHCAPLAHKALGTFPRGSLRFSFSAFNTEEEVARTVEALRSIAG